LGCIVVGVDGSEHACRAVIWAARQASRERRPLVILHSRAQALHAGARAVLESAQRLAGTEAPDGARVVSTLDRSVPADLDHLRSLLEESVAGLRETFPDVEVDLRLTRDLVDECLMDQEPSAELVVVGRRRARGVDRFLYASCAFAVLERATTTVAVVPETDPSEDLAGEEREPS
jgi:nucleotide-binding universal stress UspA family protein